MKVREPVARPLDVVAAELLLSASQAFLAGVLLYLAVGVWDDRGVGFGPVAIILAGLGAAIGGGWLYWLMGGVGWPLAAANVPAAMFLGFALVLGWRGDDLFRVEGVPLLLSLAASVYGIVCGVFLDSPRRWRWDQRQRPRPGTSVPRVSPTTRTIVASVPRSLPRRPLVAPMPPGAEPGTPVGGTSAPDAPAGESPAGGAGQKPAGVDSLGSWQDDGGTGGAASPSGSEPEEHGASPWSTVAGPPMPTQRLDAAARGTAASPTEDGPGSAETSAIELPTSIEPKAQRSPWAWAAPPEWNRDEDDTPLGGGSSGGR